MSVVLPITEDPRFRLSTATAGQTAFSVPFPFQANADIAVIKIDGTTGEETELEETTHYALTGAGADGGGTATLVTGATAGDLYLRVGRAVLDRVTSITRSGRFRSRAIDDDIDRFIIIAQELSRDTGRALKVAYGAADPDALPAAEAGKVLVWKENLQGFENGPPMETIQDWMDRAEAAAGLAEGYANDAISQGNVPIYKTLVGVQTLEIPAGITEFRVNAYSSLIPGGAGLYAEIPNTGDLLPGQVLTNPAILARRWENRDDTVTPSTFGKDIATMLAVSLAQMQIPADNYEFDEPIPVRAGAVIRAEHGATLIPTFEPTGEDRGTPLVDLGVGCQVGYLKLQLDAGINEIHTGFRLGDGCQVGHIEVVSADINLNRINSDTDDLISGAVVINGDHIRIGRMMLDRFDRGWTVTESNDVIIWHIRNTETLMGGYVNGTRGLHVLSGHTTGASLADATGLSEPRGPMTPGLNSLLLKGCADSSFRDWYTYDILEHGIRVGGIDDDTDVPNHCISFINHWHYRPYGCGIKLDDSNAFNIKHILIEALYTEDVGRGNWFGEVDYQNWSTTSGGLYVNTPGSGGPDGNKQALAIRNCQHVRVSGFTNRANAYDDSGTNGLWIERSNNVLGGEIDTEKSREHGVLIQSGGTEQPEKIHLDGVASRENGGSGLKLDASPGSVHWRGTVITGLDSQNNDGYGYEVTAALGGSSPFNTRDSRIEGRVSGNVLGGRSVASVVQDDPQFIDEVREEGAFTPTFTFATPGDVALTDVVATGVWRRNGRRMWVEVSYSATVTHTTASGNLRLGVPLAAASSIGNIGIQSLGTMVSWASRTEIRLNPVVSNSFLELRAYGPTSGGAPLGASHITSGTNFSISFAGDYRI